MKKLVSRIDPLSRLRGRVRVGVFKRKPPHPQPSPLRGGEGDFLPAIIMDNEQAYAGMTESSYCNLNNCSRSLLKNRCNKITAKITQDNGGDHAPCMGNT